MSRALAAIARRWTDFVSPDPMHASAHFAAQSRGGAAAVQMAAVVVVRNVRTSWRNGSPRVVTRGTSMIGAPDPDPLAAKVREDSVDPGRLLVNLSVQRHEGNTVAVRFSRPTQCAPALLCWRDDHLPALKITGRGRSRRRTTSSLVCRSLQYSTEYRRILRCRRGASVCK